MTVYIEGHARHADRPGKYNDAYIWKVIASRL